MNEMRYKNLIKMDHLLLKLSWVGMSVLLVYDRSLFIKFLFFAI